MEGEVQVIFGGRAISMPRDDSGRYADGTKFYLTGLSGNLYAITSRNVYEITETDELEINGTNKKIIDIFNERVKEAQTLEPQKFKWKFFNKVMPLVDLTAGFRNLITAIRPKLDFMGGSSIMRGFDGAMLMLYGACKVYDAIGKLRGAFHESHIDYAPFSKFLDDGEWFDRETWRQMLTECFASVKCQELVGATGAVVQGLSVMLLGFMMILLSAVLWSGKTVILPLAKVLMGMYFGNLILSVMILYTSVMQSYKLWVFHSALQTRLLDRKQLLLYLLEKFEPKNMQSNGDLLESVANEFHALIASDSLKEKLRTHLATERHRYNPQVNVELIQEILDDNVKQRTIHAVKIMLGLWGVLYSVVGLITTGGLANIALNALALAVSFAVLSCFAWFAVDNGPLADMVGNAGVWLVQKKNELFLPQSVREQLHFLRNRQGHLHTFNKPTLAEENVLATSKFIKNHINADYKMVDDWNRNWVPIINGARAFGTRKEGDDSELFLQQLWNTAKDLRERLHRESLTEDAIDKVMYSLWQNSSPGAGIAASLGCLISLRPGRQFTLVYCDIHQAHVELCIQLQNILLLPSVNGDGPVTVADLDVNVHITIPKNGSSSTGKCTYTIPKVYTNAFSMIDENAISAFNELRENVNNTSV